MAAAPENLHAVKSSGHFQELLKQDLNRVSLISFWADWAEPCKRMNDVVTELAKKHPKLLVLTVEAEDQPDISESFDVESVPHLLLLRGHTLLHTTKGADEEGLRKEVEKHLDVKPAADLPASIEPSRAETEEEVEARVRGLMKQSAVVLFMKGTPELPRCGFSRKIVAILRDLNVKFTHFDVLTDEAVRQGIKKVNDWPTIPQLIIDGELVGGLDVVQEMVDNGEFQELLSAVQG